MPRSKMPFTWEDMGDVVTLMEKAPATVAAGAKLLNRPRPHIYRLTRRINAQFGISPDESWWRGDFHPPPQLRRMARVFGTFMKELDEVAVFPRVAAGTSLVLLMGECAQYDARFNEVAIADRDRRSDQALVQLHDREIDLALVHAARLKSARKQFENSRDEHVLEGLKETEILTWQAVVVTAAVSRAAPAPLRWEQDSFAHWLTEKTREALPLAERRAAWTLGYATAVEQARRGIPVQFVIPHILVGGARSSGLENHLKIRFPHRRFDDCVVAVYRTEDETRLQPLLQKAIWRRIADGLDWVLKAAR